MLDGPDASDVTGSVCSGHLDKLAGASGVSAVIDSAAAPRFLDALAAGHVRGVPGATWTGFGRTGPSRRPRKPLLVADSLASGGLLVGGSLASGGLLVAGEVPGAPVTGSCCNCGD